MFETYDDVLGTFLINKCKKRGYGDIGDRETNFSNSGDMILNSSSS